MEESDVSLVHMDGTQDGEVIIEAEKLEEPLHFKTTRQLIFEAVTHEIKNQL